LSSLTNQLNYSDNVWNALETKVSERFRRQQEQTIDDNDGGDDNDDIFNIIDDQEDDDKLFDFQ
jgi:hypothetical protein